MKIARSADQRELTDYAVLPRTSVSGGELLSMVASALSNCRPDHPVGPRHPAKPRKACSGADGSDWQRTVRGDHVARDTRGRGSVHRRAVRIDLKMRIDLPSDRAASGNRFAPNSTMITTARIAQCQGLRLPLGLPPFINRTVGPVSVPIMATVSRSFTGESERQSVKSVQL